MVVKHPLLATAALLHAGGELALWGNLGLWAPGRDYATANRALADAVGHAAQLGPDDEVLSLACGAGEELLHWVRAFGVRRVTGLEREPALVAAARLRLSTLKTAQAQVVTSADVLRDAAASPGRFDAVLVLDAAYHFSPRSHLLQAAATALRPGGRLAYTDLVLDNHKPGRSLLRAAARLAGLGFDDLVSEARQHERLAAAGFCDIHIQRCDDAVLDGFARFVPEQRRRLGARARGAAWRRAAITAALISPCRAAGLGYALISARKSAAG